MSSADQTRLVVTAISMATIESNDSENASAVDGGYSSLGALESLHYSLPGMVIVGGILSIVMAATALGNFLVGLSLVRYRSLQTVSNYLIGNLAASDFLLATTVLPLSTVDECLGRWVLGRAMCNVWLLADVLYCTASIWNLLVIAFDRYTATLFPLWYRERRSAKQAGIYVALVWLVAFATCVPPLLGWNSLSQNYVYHNETASYHCVLFQTPSYVVYSASVSFYVPFLLTFFLYVRIFFVLRKRIRRMRESTEAKRRSVKSVSAASRPVGQAPAPSDHLGKGLELTTVLVVSQSRCPILMNSDVSPLHGYASNVDDSTSKSPLTSDSDELDGFESCTLTTLHSPSTALPSTPLSSTPAPSTPVLSTPLPSTPSSTPVISIPVASTHLSTTPLRAIPLPATPLPSTLPPSTPLPATSLTSSSLLLTPSSIQSRHFYLDVKSGEKCSELAIPLSLEKPETRTKMDLLSPSVCEFDQRFKAKSCHLQVDQRRVRGAGRRKGQNSTSSARSHSNGTRSGVAARARGGRYERREMRATVRMSAIIGVFCGMWIGFFSVYVVKGLWGGCCLVPRPLEAFFFWLGYSNSAINPVLYTIFNDEFRKAFLKILGCYPKKLISKTRR